MTDSTVASSASVANKPGYSPRKHFWFAASLFAILVAGMTFIASGRSTEPDIWWHLKNAEYLFTHHAFPSVDVYSYTAAGSPWLNHEWLSEIPYYLAYRAWGLAGLYSVYLWIHVIIFAGIYYLAFLRSGREKDAVVASLLGLMLTLVNMGPRMLLFGWLCMVALLILLELYDLGKIKHLWWLPLLFGIWINLHGSWVFGGIVLGIYIVAGFQQQDWGLMKAQGWDLEKRKHLFVASLTTIPALFVNPFGYRLPWYPFDLLFKQQINILRIDEWRPVTFDDSYGKILLASLAVLFVSSLVRQQTWKPQSLLLMAFAIYVACAHMRFLFFAGIILAPILAEHVELMGEYEPKKDNPWVSKTVIAMMLAMVIYLYPSNAFLQRELDDEYPASAVNFMRRQKVQGRLFNEYLFGGYLIWHAPEYKPFIDGRADIFVYNGVFDECLKVIDIKQPLEILDKYKVEWVLIAPAKPLGYVLAHSGKWKMVYTDQASELYQRTAPLPAEGPSTK